MSIRYLPIFVVLFTAIAACKSTIELSAEPLSEPMGKFVDYFTDTGLSNAVALIQHPAGEYVNGIKLNQSGVTESQFDRLASDQWREVMFDTGAGDWQQHWFADGLVGKAENTPEGMHIQAGPEPMNHAHHFVLWTKHSFEGDLKIEYDYTRTDNALQFVNILYVQATGEGTDRFDTDIAKWASYRDEPYMRHYFDNMNALHVSYAAYGVKLEDNPKDYVRARRYLPLLNKGLKGTALEGDDFDTGFFEPGVPHKITVIKRDEMLLMKVQNAKQTKVYQWSTTGFPEITEGRIGLRHMFTRSALYKNIRVSVM